MPNEQPCPCGSGGPYRACCGPYLDGKALPETAEALMRSRYTAYTRGDAAYLAATWHPSTRRKDLELGEPVKWMGLEILRCEAGGPGDTRGQVEFVARYKLGGKAHRLREASRFRRCDGRWYYLDGALDPGRGQGQPSDEA
jgi:SEC-C motif domain protein